MKTTKILIADDHEVVRDGLKNILLSLGSISVVAEAANGEEAVSMYTTHKPDMVIMDISMPGMNGIDLAAHIGKHFVPAPSIIFVSAFDDYALKAFEVRALDYLARRLDLK